MVENKNEEEAGGGAGARKGGMRRRMAGMDLGRRWKEIIFHQALLRSRKRLRIESLRAWWSYVVTLVLVVV